MSSARTAIECGREIGSALDALVGGEAAPRPTIATLLERTSKLDGREGADARLHELGKTLERKEARRIAYKTAYALAVADLATSDEEFEFDLQLIDSLALSQDEADELAAEVMNAFGGMG